MAFVKGVSYASKRKFNRKIKKTNQLATKSYVNRVVHSNIENKVKDTPFTTTTAGPQLGWYAQCLNAIDKGSNVGERIGEEITPRSLKLKMDCIVHASNTLGETVRVLLIKDKQSRGAVPTATELGLTTGDYAFTYMPPQSGDYAKRFVILSDKTYQLDTSQNYKSITISKKLQGKIYFGETGLDYQANSLFLVWYGRDQTNKTSYAFSSELFYEDA